MLRKNAVPIVLILIFALILPVLAADPVSEPAQTVYFAADFNGGSLPADTEVITGDGGLVYAENGVLTIEASDTYPPVTAVLFPYRISEPEYVFECDMCFYRVLSDGSWFSLCFGAQNDEMLYQFTVKPNASLADSAALLCRSGEASWKTLNYSSVSDYITDKGLDKYKFIENGFTLYTHYRVSVAVRNGTAFGYIDGVKVLECRLNGSSSGYVGFNCRGVTVKLDDVRLHNVLPYSVSAADSFSAEPYKLETGVISPPVIMQRDKQNADPHSGASSVLFTVKDAGGELRSYDGAVDLGTLGSRLKLYSEGTIPAFYVSDEAAAAELSSYLSVNFINDAFVIVSQTSLCRCFGNNRFVRIALDLSSRDRAGTDDVYRLLYKNDIRTVILSREAAGTDTVTELRERMISVWVSCTPDPSDAFNAAAAGAECIITSDAKQAAELFESVRKTVLMRQPVVISDGGDTDYAPYCSKSALLKAYKSGIKVLQVSVRNTKDGKLVLHKSDTTEGMSEKCAISETNLADLKTLTYDDTRVSADERILTLEELFDMTADSLKNAVIHVFVNDEENAKSAIRIAEEYGAAERCVIVSNERSVINAVNDSGAGAAASYSGGPYVFDKNDSAWSLSSLCETLTGYNSVYRGSADGMPPEFLHSVRLRGIPAYISSSEQSLPADMLLGGYDGFTVTGSTEASRYVRSLNASTDAGGRLYARIVYFDGTELDVTALCELFPLSGDVKMAGGVISGEGVYAVLCPQTAPNGEKYFVCSYASAAGIAAEVTTDGYEAAEEEENNTVIVIAAITAGVAVASGLTALGVTAAVRKKTEKNDSDELSDEDTEEK